MGGTAGIADSTGKPGIMETIKAAESSDTGRKKR